jgi:hypothetical protein
MIPNDDWGILALRRRNQRRRGVILVIVVILLALFATIGVAFVLYATSHAESTRIYREAEDVTTTELPPEVLLEYFLSQLLFDVRDDSSGVGSALRGHSLMRGTWGLNYEIDANRTVTLSNNTVAFSGTGRLHHTYPDASPPALRRQDDFALINYTHFPADGFLRDPERLGFRTGPTAPRGPYAGAFNVSYTYPDLNNVFLAGTKADGTLLIPSFHRPWLFGPLDADNPNWTSPEGKYKILRPRPAEHPPVAGRPGFPFADDAGGDVKNLIGAPGGNDSVWLDLGYPVMTAPNGRKFKPLFAPLVLDLDGRLNVNVHGNIRGADATHVSNQGWGPWEVALNRVFANPDEYRNLFQGVGRRLVGRYGPDLRPSGSILNPFAAPPPFYSRADYDACRADGTPTAAPRLPIGAECFPTYPDGWDNGSPAERAAHPSGYRIQGFPAYVNAADYDRRFAVSNLERLLRFGDTGSGALTSELVQLCPKTFAIDRARRLITTDSADLDRPGAAPWLSGKEPSASVLRDPRYPIVPDKLVGGGPKPFPSPARRKDPAPYSDFDPQGGRSLTAALGRIDLSTPLPNYPQADPATGRVSDISGFLVAQACRQRLAEAIYLRLVKVTGAYDPTALLTASAIRPNYTLPTPQDLQALRWLAQLAVNIVDDVDADDVMTPFNWGAVGSPAFAYLAGGEWVFGTELPHVLISEVYGEYLNDPGEVGPRKRATKYQVNLWIELLNPFHNDSSRGTARLDGAYQLLVAKANTRLLGEQDMGNVLGDPDGTQPGQVYDPNQVYRVLSAFDPATVAAADQPGNGFYVIAPPPWLAADPGTPAVQPTMRSEALTYSVPVRRGQVLPPPQPTILLRRLACPSLPWQPDSRLDPVTAPYNPYVTVDWAANVELNRGATNTGAGFLPAAALPVERRRSSGRREPYDGRDIAFGPQTPAPPLAGQPQHTFFAHNQPREDAYQWLVHLDRPPVSPIELLHVSTCKPHQLTHLFRNSVPDPYLPFRHTPAWGWDDSSPLYRLFAFLDTGYRAAGTAPGGRIPGRININSIWDPEVFSALCDPQPANSFAADDVAQIYEWLLASRSPDGAPGPSDRPFRSPAAAHYLPSGDTYADGVGIADTIFRGNPAHPLYDERQMPIRLFEVARAGSAHSDATITPEHPQQRFELLNKIFNQVTTRSNVFAVWVTVGFFEVNDETTTPPRLGAELGRAENRHVRHRMFAIVDRSQLVPIFPAPGHGSVTAATPIAKPGTASVVPTALGDSASGTGRWSIRPGTVLHVRGPTPDGVIGEENVVVSAVGQNWFTATFTGAYPRGLTSITAYGNPGPRAVLGTPDAAALVPHVSIIQ